MAVGAPTETSGLAGLKTMIGYVYILQFDKSGQYYVGSTGDLDKRLIQHSRGQTHTTKKNGSFQLMFSQQLPTLALARTAEKRIKSWRRRDYIERIIREGRINFIDEGR
jgi:putative endonuclease